MALFWLVLACAFWGLSFPVIKVLQLEQQARLPGAGDTFLAAWLQCARFGLGALLLVPLVARIPRPTRTEIAQGLQLAVWGGLGMGLQAWALGRIDASTSAFLTQAHCVFLPLIACVRHRRFPSSRILGASLLVAFGVAILAGISPTDLHPGTGELITLAAALVFTCQILALEAPRYRENRGRPVTFVMCAGIALLALPITVLTAPCPAALLQAGASLSAATFVLVLALFCSVGAFLLMNSWQKHLSATEAGLIYTSEPVFASFYALFLPLPLALWTGTDYANEPVTFSLLAGGGLILAANVWMQWKRRPHRPAIAPSP